MKTRIFQKMVIAAVLSLLALELPAQETTNPPPHLAFGVSDIIKLSQAKLSDDTIITFINAVGDDYALTADQIIYLRQQGVSETVIKVMLHSRGGIAATIPPPELNFVPVEPAAPSPPVEAPAITSSVDSNLLANQQPAADSPAPASATDSSTILAQPTMVVQPPGSVTILPSVENIDNSQPAVAYYPALSSYYPAYGYGWSTPFVTVSSGNFYGHRFGGFRGTTGFHGGSGFHGSGHFGGSAYHH